MKKVVALGMILAVWTATAGLAETNEWARPRIWTSASGTELLAIFVQLSDGGVILRNRAGERIQIPRDKLSAADQALLDEAFGPVSVEPTSAGPVPMPTEVPPPASEAQGSIFSYSNAPSTSWGSSPAPAAAATNSAVFSADAPPLSGTPPATYPPGATPEEKAAIDAPLFDQVPSKWFNNAKDYEELLALQKKTGACMLVYFKNPSVPNEKGLCSWFEKSITTDIDWRKAMKYFIKLEITLPGPSAVRELTELYKVSRTPAIFVVKPGSTLLARLMVFEYPAGGRPQPIAVPVVLEALKSRCNPAYQTLF